MPARATPQWVTALGVSVVLHALALGFLWRARGPTPSPAEAPRATAAAAAHAVEFIRIGLPPRGHRDAPTSPPPTRARPNSPPPASTTEAAAPLDQAAAPLPVGDSAREPLPAEESAAGAGSPFEPTTAAPTGAATERPNVSELLHARLAAAAAHCYPPAARRFRQRGEATVAFCVSGGVATNVRLDHPSGSSLLDAAATECVVPSASPYPDAANDGCFRVPVRFGE